MTLKQINSKKINPDKFNLKWIISALSIIIWALLEEIVLSSSDLCTNFFASKIQHGENQDLYNFVQIANSTIKSWGSTDNPYISHLYTVGDINISGIAASTQIYVVVISVLFGLTYGIGVYTAQYFGAKKFQNLRDLVTFKIQISLLFSFIFIILIQLFARDFIGFIINVKDLPKPNDPTNHESMIAYFDDTASRFSVDQGTKYLKVVSFSYILLAIDLSMVTTLRETKRPIVSFFASFLAFLFTIIFLIFLVEPLFLSNFEGFGILGCAYSVILGKIVQIILLCIFILIKKYEFIPNRFFHTNKKIIWISFRKSIIVTINELLWSMSMLMQVKLLSLYSLESLAANAVVSVIVSLLVVPVYHGVSAGISVLVGNNLGNNQLKLAENNSKRLIFLTLILGIFVSFVLIAVSFLLALLFSNISENIINLAKNFLLIYAVTVPILILNGTFYSLIRAGGLVRTAFFMDSFYNWAILIPIMVILILYSNLYIVVIFAIIKILESLKILPSIFFYIRKKWLKNLVYKI